MFQAVEENMTLTEKAHSPSKGDIMVLSNHNIRKLAPTTG